MGSKTMKKRWKNDRGREGGQKVVYTPCKDPKHVKSTTDVFISASLFEPHFFLLCWHLLGEHFLESLFSDVHQQTGLQGTHTNKCKWIVDKHSRWDQWDMMLTASGATSYATFPGILRSSIMSRDTPKAIEEKKFKIRSNKVRWLSFG